MRCLVCDVRFFCAEEFKHWVAFANMPFIDKSITIIKWLYIHLPIRKYEGQFIYLLQEGHRVVNIPVFVITVKYVQCIGWAWIVIFYITRVFLKSQLQITTSLSYIWFMAGLACDFVYATFFALRFLILCCGSYKLLQSCCSFECYAYISISKQVGNFPYLGTMVSECGHILFLSLFLLCVWLVLLYICRLSFLSRCCRKLLFLAMDCIVSLKMSIIARNM